MSKRNMIFSTRYPAYHPKKGQPTYFVEKVLNSMGIDFSRNSFPQQLVKLNLRMDVTTQSEYSDIIGDFYETVNFKEATLKHHTIRAGSRWKVGDIIMPRIWQLPGGMYAKGNKMIAFAPDIEVKKIWGFTLELHDNNLYGFIDGKLVEEPCAEILAKNDGLTVPDMDKWFATKKTMREGFSGQIICWNENLDYSSSLSLTDNSKEVVK